MVFQELSLSCRAVESYVLDFRGVVCLQKELNFGIGDFYVDMERRSCLQISRIVLEELSVGLRS